MTSQTSSATGAIPTSAPSPRPTPTPLNETQERTQRSTANALSFLFDGHSNQDAQTCTWYGAAREEGRASKGSVNPSFPASTRIEGPELGESKAGAPLPSRISFLPCTEFSKRLSPCDEEFGGFCARILEEEAPLPSGIIRHDQGFIIQHFAKKEDVSILDFSDKTVTIWDLKGTSCQPVLDDLPDEVLLHICSYLDTAENTASFARTCQRFNVISKDNAVWQTRAR